MDIRLIREVIKDVEFYDLEEEVTSYFGFKTFEELKDELSRTGESYQWEMISIISRIISEYLA